MKIESVDKNFRWIRVRMLILLVTIMLLAGKIAARSWELQVVKKKEYQKKARDQQLRTIQLPPVRGPILDRNGNEMAVSIMVPSVYTNLEDVEDPFEVVKKLSPVLNISEEKLLEIFKSKKGFVWLKRRISPDEAQQVKNLGLNGVRITYESKRFYPNGKVASHVIGLSGYDEVGLEGIELEFGKELIGSRTLITGLRDAGGRMIYSDGLNQEFLEKENKLVLTIDRSIQSIVERELAHFVNLFEAKSGSVIMMKPETGEILAMANYPDFDPNYYWKFTPFERRNRAVTDTFEPGSTMKVFTMAAGLESGAVRLTDLYYCDRGEMSIDNLIIRDSHKDEWLSPLQIIQRSSNIGISKIAFVTGKQQVYKMFVRFGFGSKTGIRFPGEASGFLRHYSQWYDVDFANVSFGHGIGVSLLQLAVAVAAIANGGKLMLPLIVKKVVSTSGSTVESFGPKVVRKVIDSKTARILSKMMISVTQEGGTGIEAALDNFLVAGKTGTAQKPDLVSGGYFKDKWVASFIGFVPADNPQIAMAIMVDEPTINYYGGIVAAPIFRRVAEKTLKIIGVIPDNATLKITNNRKEISDAPNEKRDISNTGVNANSNEAPSIITDSSASKENSAHSECVENCVLVPDFTGLSLFDAINRAKDAKVTLNVRGAGKAFSQSVPPGTKVSIGTEIGVLFESPLMGSEYNNLHQKEPILQ